MPEVRTTSPIVMWSFCGMYSICKSWPSRPETTPGARSDCVMAATELDGSMISNTLDQLVPTARIWPTSPRSLIDSARPGDGRNEVPTRAGCADEEHILAADGVPRPEAAVGDTPRKRRRRANVRLTGIEVHHSQRPAARQPVDQRGRK